MYDDNLQREIDEEIVDLYLMGEFDDLLDEDEKVNAPAKSGGTSCLLAVVVFAAFAGVVVLLCKLFGV